MKKRLLSVLLALSILFTMLPVSVVGEEVHNGTDSSDENLTFEEFVETEIVVPSGTSVEDLELPESEQTQEEQGRDPEWEETTLDTSVMMEEPLIMDDIVIPVDISHVAQIKDVGYTNLQDAFSNVTEGETIELLDDITLVDTVTIAGGNNNSFTLNLNGYILDGGNQCAIQHSGTGTLTIKDSAGDGKITSKAYIDSNGTIDLRGGSLVVESGTIENNLNSVDANAILKDHGYNGVIIVTGGTISSLHGTAIYYGYTSDFEMPSGIIIPSGTPVIKGGLIAMNKKPDLSDYKGVQVIVSENYDGSDPVTKYNTGDFNIYGYKYIKTLPEPTTFMTEIHFKDPGFNTIQSLEKKEVKIGESLMAPDIKGYTPYMFFSYDFKFIGGTPDSYDGNSIGSIEAPASTAIIENISSSSSNKYIYILFRDSQHY